MTSGVRRLWLLAGLCTAVALLMLGACGKATDGSGTGSAGAAGQPVDPTLLAFLSRARSAHHIADEHEESKQLDKAVAALRELVAGPLPGGAMRPEVREVLADTRARLADLESQRGKFDIADKDIEAGLELVEQRTYFRGHLFEVRGLLEDRRAKALRQDGKNDDALAAKKRALKAFETSMEIQAEVINQAIPAEPGK